jgi:hypothetical protein
MLSPGKDGEADGAKFDLQIMKERFYEIMDIDPVRGVPTAKALEACGMPDEIREEPRRRP